MAASTGKVCSNRSRFFFLGGGVALSVGLPSAKRVCQFFVCCNRRNWWFGLNLITLMGARVTSPSQWEELSTFLPFAPLCLVFIHSPFITHSHCTCRPFLIHLLVIPYSLVGYSLFTCWLFLIHLLVIPYSLVGHSLFTCRPFLIHLLVIRTCQSFLIHLSVIPIYLSVILIHLSLILYWLSLIPNSLVTESCGNLLSNSHLSLISRTYDCEWIQISFMIALL